MKFRSQILHAPVAFDAVAGRAEKLEVVNVVGPAFRPADDVVDFEVPRLEVGRAARTVPRLLAVETLRVASVGRKIAEVCARRNVRPVRTVEKHAELVAHAHLDQLGGFRADVYPDPFALQFLGGYERRRAPAKRIAHNVAGVGTGRDDPPEQCKRLLRRIAYALAFAPPNRREFRPPCFRDFPLGKIGVSYFWRERISYSCAFAVGVERFVGNADSIAVERPIIPPCEPKENVVLPVELAHLWGAGPGVRPNDLVAESGAPEYGVHDELQVMGHCWIAVEVNAACGLQHTAHLQQPDGHVGEIGLVRVRHCGQQHTVQRRVLRLDQVDPFRVHVRKRPGILERRTRCPGAYRRRIVRFRVERRVQVDQINAAAVHAAQNRQVVSCPDRLIGPVAGGL